MQLVWADVGRCGQGWVGVFGVAGVVCVASAVGVVGVIFLSTLNSKFILLMLKE